MTTTTTGAGAQVPDFRLTPELSEFQQKIRDYCRDHLGDADVYDRETKFPREAVDAAPHRAWGGSPRPVPGRPRGVAGSQPASQPTSRPRARASRAAREQRAAAHKRGGAVTQ